MVELEPECTLKDLVASEFAQHSLCIIYSKMIGNFELQTRLIHLLLIFYGLANMDQHKYIKEFPVMCCSTRPNGVTKEQLNLTTISFSMKDDANG